MIGSFLGFFVTFGCILVVVQFWQDECDLLLNDWCFNNYFVKLCYIYYHLLTR